MRLGRLRLMGWVTGGLVLVAATTVVANPKYYTHTDTHKARGSEPNNNGARTADEYFRTSRWAKQVQPNNGGKSSSNYGLPVDDNVQRSQAADSARGTNRNTPDPLWPNNDKTSPGASEGSASTPTRPKTRSGRVPQKYCDNRMGDEGLQAECGNGVCESGESPYNCFEDCYNYAQRTPTSECPASPNLQLRDADIRETAINSKYLWRLPGMEFVASGFDLQTGEPTLNSLFEYTYCGGEGHTLSNSERGIVYALPDQLHASPYSKCDFSVQTKSYKSPVDLAKAKAKTTNVEKSIAADYAGTSTSYAYEKSVRRGVSVTADSTRLLTESKAQCFVSRVGLNRQQINFNVEYLAAVAGTFRNTKRRKDSINRLAEVVREYGFLYYADAILGGEVSLVSSHDTSKLSNHETEELNQLHARSFSSKVSTRADQSTTFSTESTDTSSVRKTLDGSSVQGNFESATFHSPILARGGTPGSFGPAMSPDSGEVPMTWGTWAQTVDANPWPIEYTVDLTENLFDDEWAFSAAGCPYDVPRNKKCYVKRAWREAVKKYLKHLPPFETRTPAIGQYWFEMQYGAPQSSGTELALLLGPNNQTSKKLSSWNRLKMQSGADGFWEVLSWAPNFVGMTFQWNNTLVSEDDVHGIVLEDWSGATTGSLQAWSLYSLDGHLSWAARHEASPVEFASKDRRLVDVPNPGCPNPQIGVDLWMCVENSNWGVDTGAAGVSFSIGVDTNQGTYTTSLIHPAVRACDQSQAKEQDRLLVRYAERNIPSYTANLVCDADPKSIIVKRVLVHPVRTARRTRDSSVKDFSFKITRAAVRLPCGDRGSPIRNTARPTVFSTEVITMKMNDADPAGVLTFAPHPQSALYDYTIPDPPLRTFLKPPPVPLRCPDSDVPTTGT